MTKILFVCHGSICRSPAAEFVFKKLIKDKHLEHKYSCSSLALTTEEIGNDIYPPMKQALDKAHIPYEHHEAKLINQKDIDNVDYLIYMDDENRYLINSHFPGCNKALCLAQFIGQQEISDPWYHRGFDGCLQEIIEAVKNLLEYLEGK